MYSKCGCIGYAYVVFSRTSHRSLVTWNSIIAGFGNHGLGRNALELFEQMKESGVKPDSVTFVALLVACSHSGLTNRGQSLFDSMAEVYGISPSVEHFSCLVDMLGRAGRLQEVGRYMKRFPFGNDRIVLGSLLSACRLQGGVSVGEWLGEQLLKLPQTSTSPFVLLSNLYASDRMWSSAAEIRRMLKGSGLKKEPGHSLIEVKGILEKFTVGDFSHSKIEKIKDVLGTLSSAASELST
ncbi:hypothetical protein Nepgr_003125 [Nepenthes gracilis]|uniref:Pentatricopeptide repeat-containing protein n=1 Tax=Nepenthes gracilis TaxID=150966 RepID=A0AAD3RYX9_NEPGR|nr:hypothetical protein Nepgr_003125 [Nepenthes gracilis]